MKYEWKKSEKECYLPKEEPVLIKIPEFNFITISGKGNPNNEDFSKRVEVLYSVAYTIKMMPKKGIIVPNYFDYSVYPLEGLWDLTENGKKEETLNKDELLYTIMIRQPEFITNEVFLKAIDIVKKKKPNPLIDEIKFESIDDGLSVQMLHVGSYDTEMNTFSKMKEFIKQNNLEIKTLRHREIYLSDARKVEKNKLKTVLRYIVKK